MLFNITFDVLCFYILPTFSLFGVANKDLVVEYFRFS